jgi:uncharacterized protein
MRRRAVHTLLLGAGLAALLCAGDAACGQGSGPARPADGAEAEPSAQRIAALLDAGDADGLRAVVAQYPRLSQGILTTDGVTVLAYAAAAGHTGTVGVLLAAGAPLDARDAQGRTPLYLAVVRGHEAVARQLLAAGANPDLPDQEGTAPLHLAVKQGSGGVVSELLTRGAAVDVRTGRGTTPVAVAAYFGNLRLVQLLCDTGAQVNSANLDGATVLHHAALGKNPAVVRYLLARGARRDALDNQRESPADWAAKAGDPESLQLLRPPAK